MMEIPGDVFQPMLGWVHQSLFFPVGRLLPWKMTRCTIDPTRDKVDTPNNAVPDFHTSINAKRITTGKIENACFDPAAAIYGLNPYSTVNGLAITGGIPFVLHEGMYFRMLCVYNTSTIEPVLGPVIGSVIGTPITGAAAELPTAATAQDYIFMALRCTKIHHMADAAAGQPFDFDFETVYPYAIPGEPWSQINQYGFLNVVGNGGFM
jgi:hypothetical protein